MHRKLLLPVCLALFCGPLAQAQCLTLAELADIGESRVGGTQAATNGAQILSSDGWAYRGFLDKTREHYWTHSQPGAQPADNTGTPDGMVSVRANSDSRDVVLKTVSGACVRQMRTELRDLKLEPVAVNCPDCEGVRYTGKDYNVSIYSRKKGPYSHVVVLRLMRQPVIVGNGVGTSGTTSEPANAVD